MLEALEMMKEKSGKVIVVGDAMIDRYINGRVIRISPEAPVPVLEYDNEEFKLGGAANVAANLKSMGASVDICSVMGKDFIGSWLTRLLEESGIGLDMIFIEDRPTTFKIRVLADNGVQMLRIDGEKLESISLDSENKLIKNLEENMDNYDVLIFSDYQKGMITRRTAYSLIRNANSKNKKVLVNSKGIEYKKYDSAHLFFCAASDLASMVGMEITDEKTLVIAMQRIRSECKFDNVLINWDNQCLVLLDNMYKVQKFNWEKGKEPDFIGVNDTVMAAIGECLALDITLDNACGVAALAVSAKIREAGAVPIDLEDIECSFARLAHFDKGKVLVGDNWDALKEEKTKKKVTVFYELNKGVIGPKEVEKLWEVASLGDILIVGVNEERKDMIVVLDALKMVNYIYLGSGGIAEIQPDIVGSDE